ncbi:flagellar assembly protein FliH [Shewanella sp. A32]|uniref:flagellar assembly protein FliH n=1 Tax=Shewanella sp. A32 TaxID=3031327 RepID=UPI0023B9C828|nr:flagellar assembly protein FliH [Shewanella sp. A32]MDF0532977.1 flagellar assembly protein FliH [Shewanella sp. A32]
MADQIPSKNIIPPEAVTDFDAWPLPDVGASLPPKTESNLFGRKAPEYRAAKVDKPVAPPTMAEIEAIRADAEQEGFAEGKTAGFNEGLEQGRLQGLEQGHAEGFAQGLEQGKSEGLQQAQTLLTRFEQLLAQFNAPLALLDLQIEQSLLTLTEQLSRSVIAHELATHPEHILAAMRQGIDALPIKEQKVVIRLHPDDVALVESLYGAEQLARNHWQLENDPGLSAGDCLVSCQRSQVDMRLEMRLQQVFAEVWHRQQLLAREEQQQTQQLQAKATNTQADAPSTDIAHGAGEVDGTSQTPSA